MILITCSTCQHFTASNDPKFDFGKCAIGAYKKSWTPGRGRGHSPTPNDERECSAHQQMLAVLPGYVSRGTSTKLALVKGRKAA